MGYRSRTRGSELRRFPNEILSTVKLVLGSLAPRSRLPREVACPEKLMKNIERDGAQVVPM